MANGDNPQARRASSATNAKKRPRRAFSLDGLGRIGFQLSPKGGCMRRIARRTVFALSMAMMLSLGEAALGAPAPPTVSKFTDPEYVMGNPRAPVTVVEYASASCPHCARFDIKVFPQLKAKYIDTGKVRYVFREFLTPPEDLAAATFVLGRCAGKDKYFNVVEQVFRAQPEMYEKGDVYDVLLRIAKGEGLTADQFNACLHDQAAFKALDARVDQAVNKDKIDSTPTLLVNGRRIEGKPGKEIDFADVDEAITAALKAAPARPPAAPVRRVRARAART